jgi:hypothetical protein
MHVDLYFSTREKYQRLKYGYTCHCMGHAEHCTERETQLVRHSPWWRQQCAFSSLNTPALCVSGALGSEPFPSARWLGMGTAKQTARVLHRVARSFPLICSALSLIGRMQQVPSLCRPALRHSGENRHASMAMCLAVVRGTLTSSLLYHTSSTAGTMARFRRWVFHRENPGSHLRSEVQAKTLR